MDNRDPFRHNVLTSGHRACSGCGEAMAARMVADLVGPEAIYINATGCLQVFSSHNQQSAWQAPWIHSVFANAAAVASGVEAALRIKGKRTPVVVQAGDGGTFDIGLQCLSGMIERGHDVLFVCYDNEAYMNTGVQRSSSTPHAVRTTTSPPGRLSEGKAEIKKDVISIIAAHQMPYAATATIAYFPDLKAKVEKAMRIRGPRFLQVLSPCPLGWAHDSALSVTVSRLAVETGLFPLVELEYGELTGVMRLAEQKPVAEYLRPQGRFKHLFDSKTGAVERRHLQALADARVRRYGLLDADTQWTTVSAMQSERHGRGGYAVTKKAGGA
ncbi:MAG TPA: pyruvate ferredoxin oxidoreductase [Candidatus Tenderia electrophaga]|uniref:Pyruvate ferredoxin oxidoreductase n=1 Tax=Candidatus Tenderia electrophaga TaxID=1748243 RepID=A0A832J662_9GAMM|nr:pyruvate ferredoxin oxidoreductase [Candidatus Tenderia electrophaga]